MAERAPVFNQRTVAWLVLTGVAAFCAMLVLMVFGDPAANDVTKSSVFSRSAVGHSGLAELLLAEGRQVTVNRDRQARALGATDVLLVLEPQTTGRAGDPFPALLETAFRKGAPVLLALPKWRGQDSREHRGWVDQAWLVSPENPSAVLSAAGLEGAVVSRSPAAPAWRNQINSLTPHLAEPQLVEHPRLEPLIADGPRILLGRLPHRNLFVLTDPDMLANHGLHRGDNAKLMLAIADRIGKAIVFDETAIVFDETLHGFAITPQLARLAFLPPYLGATLLALAAATLTVWRAVVRFGAPLDTADAGPRGGHETLIDNAGRLLAAGGHGDHVARRYAEAKVADACRRLNITRPLSSTADIIAELNAVAARRGIRARLPSAQGKQRPLAFAKAHHHWTRELFDDA